MYHKGRTRRPHTRSCPPTAPTPRKQAIDTVTVRCFVGQVTARWGCEIFQDAAAKASANYVVGYDGSIGLCVEEGDRAWTTGGWTRRRKRRNTLQTFEALMAEWQTEHALPAPAT